MYFEDLTSYRYGVSDEASSLIYLKSFVFRHIFNRNLINIGWLHSKYTFHRRKSDEPFLDKLFNLCLFPVEKTRGYHVCPFCKSSFGLEVERNGQKVILGSAEIRVRGLEGKVYAAPNLIYHYVEAHEYSPPEEFIDAVLLT